jgi:hypothetical protein
MRVALKAAFSCVCGTVLVKAVACRPAKDRILMQNCKARPDVLYYTKKKNTPQLMVNIRITICRS